MRVRRGESGKEGAEEGGEKWEKREWVKETVSVGIIEGNGRM